MLWSALSKALQTSVSYWITDIKDVISVTEFGHLWGMESEDKQLILIFLFGEKVLMVQVKYTPNLKCGNSHTELNGTIKTRHVQKTLMCWGHHSLKSIISPFIIYYTHARPSWATTSAVTEELYVLWSLYNLIKDWSFAAWGSLYLTTSCHRAAGKRASWEQQKEVLKD